MSRYLLLNVVLVAGVFLPAPAMLAAEAPVYEADEYTEVAGVDASVQESAPSGGSSSVDLDPRQVSGEVLREGSAAMGEDDSAPTAWTQAQRIDRLEQQLDNLQHSENNKKMNQFQEEVQSLRGKVEELTHQLEQLKTRQQTMYTDLDRRLSAARSSLPVEKAAGADSGSALRKKSASLSTAAKSQLSSPVSKITQPNVAEEQQTYQLAYDLIKAEKYDQAVLALQKMLHRYPSGQFAANAHYWLGELYGLQGKNSLSAAEFQTVIKKYPNSPRLADAGLKLGLIYVAEQKWQDAKKALRRVINRHPGTASARLASEQLKQIKQAGH